MARLCAGLLVCAVAGSLSAQAAETAETWLTRMNDTIDRGGFGFSYTTLVVVGSEDDQGTVRGNGEMQQRDSRHLRSNTTMEMVMPAGQGTAEMKALAVADGEFMWTEVENSMLDELQIMKLSLDAMEQIRPQGPGHRMGAMDPLRQIKSTAQNFPFELVGVDAGRVTLRAVLPPAAGGAAVSLILDEATAFPNEFRVGPVDAPLLHMSFSEFRKQQTFENELFSYVPPAGASVVDVSESLPGR